MRSALSSSVLLAALHAAGCAPAAVSPPDPPQPRASLASVIDSVMTAGPLHRTQWGIAITELDGRVVYARNAETLFAAASNAKLATMAAALGLLGPEFRWRTRVEAWGLRDGVADGVVVRGSGDPTLSLATLDSLADSLAHAGVRRVRGPLRVDVSRFDSVQVHPAWENFDLDWYYAAPVAPFAILEGAYPVVMVPGAVGAPAAAHVLAPTGLVAVDARVLTAPGDRRWNDDLRRVAGTDSVVLRGTIGADVRADTSRIAQDEPARFAGRALRAALERRGITVAGPVIVTRDAPAAPAAGGGPAVVVWTSPPLADVVALSLEQSDNWVTEQVLKTLGAERGDGGSWSAGTAVVESYLNEEVGIDPGALYLRDGSGLTPQTLLTPTALTALLRHAAAQPWADLYRSALAAPGAALGTQERRLAGFEGHVVAKTGTLRHVNALSGFAFTRGGRTLVFSLLTNASGRPASEVQRGLDRIVAAIIEHGS